MQTVAFPKIIVVLVYTVAVWYVSPNAFGQVSNESAKLLPSDGLAFDEFGASIAVSGDVAVVGAPQAANIPEKPGTAYVFRWNGSSWAQEQKLLAEDGAPKDEFGNYVSVSGNVVAVGAWLDDDNGTDSGSAYVFRWNGSSWIEEQKLIASDGAAGDQFGSVSASGDVVVVGAFKHVVNSIESGSAYVFRWNGSSWIEEQKLVASDGAVSDAFGFSVSVSGNVAVVGAAGGDGTVSDSGSVYVFRWNGSSWIEEQKLFASDGATDVQFGRSVSVSGEVVVVGAWLDNNNGSQSGSAYLFRWNGSSWIEEQKLLASDGAAGDIFGWSVSVSGDVAVVGALWDDDNGINSGSAYPFRFDASETACGQMWCEEQKLLASDGEVSDTFGIVSISGDVAFAGARFDDDNDTDSGSAYVFLVNPPSIPAVSEWGLIIMAILVLTTGTLVYTRCRPTQA